MLEAGPRAGALHAQGNTAVVPVKYELSVGMLKPSADRMAAHQHGAETCRSNNFSGSKIDMV